MMKTVQTLSAKNLKIDILDFISARFDHAAEEAEKLPEYEEATEKIADLEHQLKEKFPGAWEIYFKIDSLSGDAEVTIARYCYKAGLRDALGFPAILASEIRTSGSIDGDAEGGDGA